MGKVSGLLVMDHAKISHNYHGTLALAIRRCIRPYVCEMCEGGRFAFCLLDKLSSLVSHYHGDQTFYLRAKCFHQQAPEEPRGFKREPPLVSTTAAKSPATTTHIGLLAWLM